MDPSGSTYNCGCSKVLGLSEHYMLIMEVDAVALYSHETKRVPVCDEQACVYQMSLLHSVT